MNQRYAYALTLKGNWLQNSLMHARPFQYVTHVYNQLLVSLRENFTDRR